MKKDNDKVPLFKTWMQWYVFVISFLLVLIILFRLMTNYFS